jgi:hypothetical protein
VLATLFYGVPCPTKSKCFGTGYYWIGKKNERNLTLVASN